MRHPCTAQFAIQIQAPFGWVGVGYARQQPLIQLSSLDFQLTAPRDAMVEALAQLIVQYLQHPQAIIYDDFPIGTAYQQSVWQAIALIPLGATASYQQIAQLIGSGARAVANACGANPWPLIVPCHRVVASRGIGGFMQGSADGLRIKEWLLRHEQTRWP